MGANQSMLMLDKLDAKGIVVESFEPGSANHNCSARTLVKSLLASRLACVCVQGAFGLAVAQGQNAPFLVHIGSQSTASQSPHAVAARLATQNALFKEQSEDDLRASPESESARGDYRDNAMLDDYSLSASVKQNAVDRAYRAKLDAISTNGFPEQDRLSHDLLLRVLDNRIADYALKDYETPISQMQGIHNSLADLSRSVPLDTVQHYEDYVARLHQIPRAFEQTIDVLRRGEKDGLMPVRILLEQIPAQCEGTIAENPFLAPTKKFPASCPEEAQKRLTEEIEQVVDSEVLPAYHRFAEFIAKDYAPHGRTTIGLNSLPDGARRYQQAIREQTTTDMSPAEIHALGFREVERINGQLTSLAIKAGYKDLASFRAALNSDPKYIPKSPDQIVDDFRRYVGQMQPRLPELFGVFPKTPLTVEAAPTSQPNNPTHYIGGNLDGSRPARVVVATSNYARRKLLSDETQAYHEDIPGHHLQISIQQRLTGLPEFRLHIINNAYAEGWAVYAEALGKEIGFFQDPASDYGRLNLELMRAVRLVVDTGIHSEGWSRGQGVAYFRDSGAGDEPTIQAEIDRYIAWPGQGLSYQIGQLKTLDLRDRAKQRLGARFDIRAFHDEILSGGSLPLDMLEVRVDNWIGSQLPNRDCTMKLPRGSAIRKLSRNGAREPETTRPASVVDSRHEPVFRLGVRSGETVMVHAPLRAVGEVAGGVVRQNSPIVRHSCDNLIYNSATMFDPFCV
jgi:uncharacterized protein (DUF885 family)